MEDRYGIWLLGTDLSARPAAAAKQISTLLEVDEAEVERALATVPNEAVMTAQTREEAERMQDAFTAGGVATRIVAIGRDSVDRGTSVPAGEGRATDARAEEPAIDGPDPAGAPGARDSSSRQNASPVGRWIAESDQARAGDLDSEPGGLTITIPPMNREQRVTVGAAGVTAVGLFAPVIRGPLGVTFSFVDGSSFTALVLFVGCLLVAGLVATRRTALSVIPLVAVVSIIGYRFVRISWEVIRLEGEIQAMQQEDFLGLSGALLGDVGMAWGWALLLLGAGGMVYGVAALLRRNR